jgi:hypothetical protein
MQETTQVTYGAGTITVTISTESGTEVAAPAVRFGSYYDGATACLTDKELEEVAVGGYATVDLHYYMTDELTNSAEEKSFTEGITKAEISMGDLQRGVYLEAEAEKTIGGGEKIPFDTLYEDVEFQIDVPLYLVAEGRGYYLMTNVMGVCALDDDVDTDADTLSVMSHNIGTSLILYQDGVDAGQKNNSKLTIKSQYLFIGAIIALVLIWWTVDRKYKRNKE